VKTERIFLTVSLTCAVLALAYCVKVADQLTLKDAFKERFLIGAALNDDVVSGRDSGAAEIVKKHFNTVTSENAMKWAWIHPRLNSYEFGPADRFVEFGERNGMFIVGHTLVWHSQVPGWAFEDDAGQLLKRDAMLARMKDHIATLVGRYKGRVKAWDVVNEALTDEGGLRDTRWSQTIGEDFIARAFEYAHQTDPEAELYYNDFSLDKPAKRDACIRLVKDLKASGLRVDGVGIQGHWGMDYPTNENLEAFISATAALRVKVMVTEMDIDILPTVSDNQGADIAVRVELQKDLNPYVDGLPDVIEKKLTDRYVELFSILCNHSKEISRVTFWGVYDKTSWLNNWPVRGRTSYPLLFARNYRPKSAFYGVIGTAETKK
jgi:endo-1,4-beta-xylanase